MPPTFAYAWKCTHCGQELKPNEEKTIYGEKESMVYDLKSEFGQIGADGCRMNDGLRHEAKAW